MTEESPTCSVEGCDRKVRSRGMCTGHYRAALRDGALPIVKGTKGTPPRKPKERPSIPPVVADVAWLDTHPGAPGGQRCVLYTCPACGRQHLIAWLPLDEHPGLKIATCREKSASQNAPIPMFFVLAPAVILENAPAGYAPGPQNVEVEAGDRCTLLSHVPAHERTATVA